MPLRLESCKCRANGRSGLEWTKASVFSFEIHHHVVAAVYNCLGPFRPGDGIHSIKGFPSLLRRM